MLTHCPHCRQTLKLSGAQIEKINGALAALPAGKTLKIACPLCREAIELNNDGSAAGKKPRQVNPPPRPPEPPDLGWLTAGGYREERIIEKVPQAMLLMTDEARAEEAALALAGLGYQVTRPATAEEAVARMQFMNFELVILHSRFEETGMEQAKTHRYLREMGMSSRRYLFYVLVGPEFRTLYPLEALAMSANLVINENDLPHLPLLIKKGLHDHQALFGPYIEALGKYGVK